MLCVGGQIQAFFMFKNIALMIGRNINTYSLFWSENKAFALVLD